MGPRKKVRSPFVIFWWYPSGPNPIIKKNEFHFETSGIFHLYLNTNYCKGWKLFDHFWIFDSACGALSQIFSLLNEISYGYEYIEIWLVFRESTLLIKILRRAESWQRLYQLETLEEVDLMFFKQLFSRHSKSGTEFCYSETGNIPIRLQMTVLKSIKTEMFNGV